MAALWRVVLTFEHIYFFDKKIVHRLCLSYKISSSHYHERIIDRCNNNKNKMLQKCILHLFDLISFFNVLFLQSIFSICSIRNLSNSF